MAEDEGIRLAEHPVSIIPHKSEAESRAIGKEARATVPRASHATFEPAPDRPDPVSLLEEQATTRVPELVPIRYGRMLVSPFTFFRGAALIMASDLSTTPTSGLTAQICGDAHLSNFGVFGSPERQTRLRLQRLRRDAPGAVGVGHQAPGGEHRGGRPQQGPRQDRCAPTPSSALGQAYRESMRQMATMSNLEVWYFHVDVAEVIDGAGVPGGGLGLEGPGTHGRDGDQGGGKGADEGQHEGARQVDRGRRRRAPHHQRSSRCSSRPKRSSPKWRPINSTTMFRELLRRYRQSLSTDRRHLLEEYSFSQMARKVVGVGSVGTRVWVILMHGAGADDVLFLQAKEAEASVLERFTKKSVYGNHGARVVAGQRLMQASSDIFLGWQRTEGLDGASHDYYVRQLQDWKGSIDTDTMVPQGLEEYGKLCALTLARAHARSGDRFAMAAYLGNSNTFEKALAKFAESYADQNERDYEAFAAACKSGRLHAEEGM